jgi:hypothetical protein
VKFNEREWKVEERYAKRVHNEADWALLMCCEVLHGVKIDILNSHIHVSEDACPLRLHDPVEFV